MWAPEGQRNEANFRLSFFWLEKRLKNGAFHLIPLLGRFKRRQCQLG
ncbi:hypothetical protein L345_17919, partial [Ophiophagus hannah]